eukprot:GHUV01046972.1.p1 GENE.GHUV01046972.1~~GHUV01046972.1.p1  ORF type:complete len:251 (-),score=40.12 GHUV01046972.1:287-1039(-)
MNKLLIAALFGLILLSAPFVRAEEEEYEDDSAEDTEEKKADGDDEKDVKVLTQKNWDELVKGSKFALVEFYAPWCGHCQKLKPDYAKAATALAAHDATIVIGKVDATVESDLGQKFGVQGYPTLKWFVDGEVASDYSGPRDVEGIVRWVKKKTGPAAATIEDKDGLSAAEKDSEVIVIGYFKDFKVSEWRATAQSVDILACGTLRASVVLGLGTCKFGWLLYSRPSCFLLLWLVCCQLPPGEVMLLAASM